MAQVCPAQVCQHRLPATNRWLHSHAMDHHYRLQRQGGYASADTQGQHDAPHGFARAGATTVQLVPTLNGTMWNRCHRCRPHGMMFEGEYDLRKVHAARLLLRR